MTIYCNDLLKIIDNSSAVLNNLYIQYEKMPATKCSRSAKCCTLLPETTFAEALAVLKRLIQFSPSERIKLWERLIRYYILNPVDLTTCPFLVQQECLIYEDRFFGCRVYGLWSESYYDRISEQNRLAKSSLQQQWQKMGVCLPEKIISFHLPYCQNVQLLDNVSVNDAFLVNISENIDKLSGKIPDYHLMYNQHYFSDLSFFIASIIFGYTEAVQIKFKTVKEYIRSDGNINLQMISENVYDIFS